MRTRKLENRARPPRVVSRETNKHFPVFLMPLGGSQQTGRDPVLAPLEVATYVVLSGPVKFG